MDCDSHDADTKSKNESKISQVKKIMNGTSTSSAKKVKNESNSNKGSENIDQKRGVVNKHKVVKQEENNESQSSEILLEEKKNDKKVIEFTKNDKITIQK